LLTFNLTVLTKQVNPVNSLHWARTPHHQPMPYQRLQLLVITLHNLQCKVDITSTCHRR